MPRRNRRAEEVPPPSRMPQSAAPGWALFSGFDVRQVSSEKPYTCPGCELIVRPGTWHLVVVPQDDPDARRHWHEHCWKIELNRTRGRPRGPAAP